MATTLDQISQFLTKREIKHDVKEADNRILTGFKTSRYRDPDGDSGLAIVIQLEEKGEYLTIFCPKVYQYKEGPHALAVMQACLLACYRTKLLQFEYDPSDGEIRAVVEIPLEDAVLTEKQFFRLLFVLPRLIEDLDPLIRKAMTEGKVEFPEQTNSVLMRQLAALASSNPDELRRVLEELERRRAAAAAPPEQL